MEGDEVVGGDEAGQAAAAGKKKAKKKEEMKEAEKEVNLSGFNPVDSVKEACVECGIDWRSADFDEKDMLRRF